ncbi:MAG: hypothetical protein E5W00_07460, partial [Mesorhizobium sp.]
MASRRSILEKAKAADLRPQGVDGKRLQKVLDRAKKFFRRPSRHADESVERHVRLMAQSIERRDWQAAREHALALGLLGEQLGDPGLVKKAGRGLRRLGGGNR